MDLIIIKFITINFICSFLLFHSAWIQLKIYVINFNFIVIHNSIIVNVVQATMFYCLLRLLIRFMFFAAMHSYPSVTKDTFAIKYVGQISIARKMDDMNSILQLTVLITLYSVSLKCRLFPKMPSIFNKPETDFGLLSNCWAKSQSMGA